MVKPEEKDCKKLTARQLATLQASYPKPKIKQKYRMQSQIQEAGETVPVAGLFEVDPAGNKIVDTFQTVRVYEQHLPPSRLLELIDADTSLGVLRFLREPGVQLPIDAPARVSEAEQSNTSVVYDTAALQASASPPSES